MPPESTALGSARHAPLDLSAFGVRIRLEFADALDGATVASIRDSWVGALVSAGDPAEPDEILPVEAGVAPDTLAERLTVRVTLAALARRSGELLLFHACGVADPDGRVAAFVGPSGRGKTTLSRALGSVHGYVSDETIALDTALSVLPYRKPLSVVREGRPKEQVSPQAAGLRPLPDAPLALAALVLIDRDAERPGPELEQVPFVDAIAELAPQMSYLAELPRPLQTVAALCDRIGGVVRLTYPDASTVAPILPQLLDHARVHEPWEPALASAENPDFDLSGVTDAIRCGDRVVVLAQRWVHVLDGIAPAIWDSVRAGRPVDGVVADVVERYGAPEHGDARALTEEALAELVDAGVLRRRP